MTAIRFGVDISQHQLTWDELKRRARFAEDAGFESAWVFDHFKPLYGDPAGPCLEAWTLLAALAEATTTLRLGAMVTGVTYRHPSVLAAEAVTVDHVSNGRLELGLGAAWFEDEHRELGIPFPATGERVSRLEEALGIITALMTQDGVAVDGRYWTLDHATYRPRPVQQPHPPIWIGASGRRRTLPIAGRYADVWHSFGGPSDLASMWNVVEQSAIDAGRDPASIVRSTSLSISEPFDEVRSSIDALADAGVSYLVVSWPGDGQERVADFVDQVASTYR